MLSKFSKEAICIDSTHGTNIYDFYLITVLVLDDYKEGIPVAWLISNREDAAVLRQFFSKIKEQCGDISTNVFMSDDADNFFNGWKGVLQSLTPGNLSVPGILIKAGEKVCIHTLL